MIRKFFTLFIITLSVHSIPTFATRYHVNINSGDDANNGLKWSTAFKNLQVAIDSAKSGDEIWLAAGTYHPTQKIADVYGTATYPTTPTNARHRNFLIQKNLAIYGGFPRNPSDAIDMSSRNWKVNQTILSGDFDNNDGYNFENMEENAFHVVILFDASPSMLLDGLYITGGCADDIGTVYTGNTRYYYVTSADGGGIYAYSPSHNSSPTIQNVSFYGNYARGRGGAMYNYSYAGNAAPRLTNVSIIHNKAYTKQGGGLFNEGSWVSALLINVDVVGNESAMSGGGIYFNSIDECSPTLANCVVSGNASGNFSGGVYMATYSGSAAPIILNSTICGNKSAREGGGFMVNTAGISETSILNTVIWGNKGLNGIDNFYAEGDWGKSNLFDASLIEGFTLGGTNLPGNTDPLFLTPVAAGFAPNIEGDYQLMPGSPLVNKGVNSHISISTDVLGNTRIYGGTIDIGAYESLGMIPSFNETFASEKAIWSNNNNLYVRINQPSGLSIYAIDGSLVKQISNLLPGAYSYTLPRGVYIVTLTNGKTEKVIIR